MQHNVNNGLRTIARREYAEKVERERQIRVRENRAAMERVALASVPFWQSPDCGE